MRQEKKKFAEFKRNISYILIMILCIASFSCGVSAAEYDPPASSFREYIQSAEYARTDDINYGEITKIVVNNHAEDAYHFGSDDAVSYSSLMGPVNGTIIYHGVGAILKVFASRIGLPNASVTSTYSS